MVAARMWQTNRHQTTCNKTTLVCTSQTLDLLKYLCVCDTFLSFKWHTITISWQIWGTAFRAPCVNGYRVMIPDDTTLKFPIKKFDYTLHYFTRPTNVHIHRSFNLSCGNQIHKTHLRFKIPSQYWLWTIVCDAHLNGMWGVGRLKTTALGQTLHP